MSSLGNDIRLLIFTEAMRKNVKPSEILKKTDITIQALHKQITNLVESGLVQKIDGRILLTEFGRNISGQIPTLEFLIKHWEYFEKHSIANLPTRYFQSIGMLRICEEIHSTVEVLEKIHHIIDNSTLKLKSIVAEYSLETAQVIINRLSRGGVTLQYIMGENTIIPRGRKDLLKRFEWDKYIKNGYVNRRMIKKVDIMMMLSESESLVLFPDYYDKVRLTSALYSKNEKFNDWCHHLFDDVWNHSYEFNEKKIKKNEKI